MSLVRWLAGLTLVLSSLPTQAAGLVDCQRADVACKSACPMDTRRAACYQACHAKDQTCRSGLAPSKNAAMPPPPATRPAAPAAVPGVNPVTRPRELAESGACKANAASCQAACGGASANPGSAAGFQHMECVRQCKVEQAVCGSRGAEVERGARLPDGRCAPRYQEMGEPGKGSCVGPYN